MMRVPVKGGWISYVGWYFPGLWPVVFCAAGPFDGQPLTGPGDEVTSHILVKVLGPPLLTIRRRLSCFSGLRKTLLFDFADCFWIVQRSDSSDHRQPLQVTASC